MQDDIAKIPDNCHVLLAGDFNAHTNNENGLISYVHGTDMNIEHNLGLHCIKNHILQ